METKCAFKSLVEEVKSAGHTNLWIGNILNDVKVLDSSIKSICFSYCLSQANWPAEKLACEGKNHTNVIYWLEESPSCIRASVAGVPYAKFLAFSAPNPKIWASWSVPYAKNFGTPLQYIWDGTDNNCKIKYYYFITFFSLLFHIYLSPSSFSVTLRLYLISSLSVTLYLFPLLPVQESWSRSLSSPHRWSCRLILQPSPPTFRSLLIGLWV